MIVCSMPCILPDRCIDGSGIQRAQNPTRSTPSRACRSADSMRQFHRYQAHPIEATEALLLENGAHRVEYSGAARHPRWREAAQRRRCPATAPARVEAPREARADQVQGVGDRDGGGAGAGAGEEVDPHWRAGIRGTGGGAAVQRRDEGGAVVLIR